MKPRIGLFGGSFDPVHLGHLLVARAACEELSLDRLYFIPAAQSPFKLTQMPAPGSERLRLLRLALAGQTEYEVDPQELIRAGLSFTIDTARDYAQRFPGSELFYLLGADHVAQLPKWREAATLAELVQFVIIPRPPGSEPPRALVEAAHASLEVEIEFPTAVSTAAIPSFRIQMLKGFPLALSSSQIRQRVRAGLSIDSLVPPEVAEAIRNNRLYLSAEQGHH